MKNAWIDKSVASCHITDNDTGLYDVTKINKSVHGSSGSMSTMEQGQASCKSEKSRWDQKGTCSMASELLCKDWFAILHKAANIQQ